MISYWNKDVVLLGKQHSGTDRSWESEVLILTLLFKGFLITGKSFWPQFSHV